MDPIVVAFVGFGVGFVVLAVDGGRYVGVIAFGLTVVVVIVIGVEAGGNGNGIFGFS